jgi:hypothetical protein
MAKSKTQNIIGNLGLVVTYSVKFHQECKKSNESFNISSHSCLFGKKGAKQGA